MLKNKKSTLKFLSYGTAFSFLSFLSFNALFPAIPSNAVSSASTVADLELEIEPTIEVAIDTETLNLTYNCVTSGKFEYLWALVSPSLKRAHSSHSMQQSSHFLLPAVFMYGWLCSSEYPHCSRFS